MRDAMTGPTWPALMVLCSLLMGGFGAYLAGRRAKALDMELAAAKPRNRRVS